MKQPRLPECYLRDLCNADGKFHTLDLSATSGFPGHKNKIRFSSWGDNRSGG